MKKPAKSLDELVTIHPNAAGLDIGAREIWCCVPTDRDDEWVRVFGTFTPDLVRLADWLVACSIETVAMESTGTYWVPVFELLEARGLEVYLVNARHIKNVPGRQSDYQDCQWIQRLHSVGLLNASFRPDAEMCRLRTYLRQRTSLVQHRSPHILHMQKALGQMNIQLRQVLTDITGDTGQAILRAIVDGERDAVKLAQLRHPGCHSSEDTIAKALTGDWKDEHLFVLKQSLELFDFYTVQIRACDAEIQRQFSAMKPRWTPTETEAKPVFPPSKSKRTKRSPAVAVRTEAIRVTGVDLVAVDGLSDALVQILLSEIGTDMSPWPSEKHFASWLGLAPHNDISGGKVLRSRTLPTSNRAGQVFRQAAVAVSRSPSAFGAFYRRKRAQSGPSFAQVATAHKIARTVYYLLKHHVQYLDVGAQVYETQQRERELTALRKKASKLGFILTIPEAQPNVA